MYTLCWCQSLTSDIDRILFCKYFKDFKICKICNSINDRKFSPKTELKSKDEDNLTLNLPNFLNGIIHLPSLALSIFILGISRRKLEVGLPTVSNLVRLHGCAGWPGNILVAKTDHFWFWRDKDQNEPLKFS